MGCSPQPSSSLAQGSVRHQDSSGAQPTFTTLFLSLKPDQPRNLASHGLCLSPAGGTEILCLISPAIRACTWWASPDTLQHHLGYLELGFGLPGWGHSPWRGDRTGPAALRSHSLYLQGRCLLSCHFIFPLSLFEVFLGQGVSVATSLSESGAQLF